MTHEDVQLGHLAAAAMAARGRQIDLGIASRAKAASSGEGPTPKELEETAAAEAACLVADRALADFQAWSRWSTPRD